VNATLLGSGRLSKIAHLCMSYSHRKVPQAMPVHRAWSISSNGGLALLQQPSLLQQPRHQLIQPSFRLDENILHLDLLDALLAKLDPGKFMRWLRLWLCTVKLSRLVFFSPPAIRALDGKLSRQTQRALHRNFASACRTAHAAQAGIGDDDFAEHCHGGLPLSGYRGLRGLTLYIVIDRSITSAKL